jgi:hypothetical protein
MSFTLFVCFFVLFVDCKDFLWVRNESVQVALLIENYLPSQMIIDQFDLISDHQLDTNHDTKYYIPARTTKRILVDCIPRETGQYRIQGELIPMAIFMQK